MLDLLNGKTTVQIPEITYRGKKYDYVGYPKIEGSTLTNEIYGSLSTEEKDKLANDLATFLFQAHRGRFPVTEGEAAGFQHE